MNKIKVLYIVPSLKLCNGVASYAMNYFRNIDKNNIEIDFLETANTRSKYFDEIEEKGCKVYSFPRMNRKNCLSVIKQIKCFFEEHINEYQIVHCNLVNSGIFFLHYAKKYNIKARILHSHATQYSDRIWKNIRNSILAQFTKKNANIYCACSKLAGDFMFKSKKYKVINNAINIEKFEYNTEIRNKIREIEKIKKNEYLIGAVGRLDPQKNPLFLIDIFEEYLKINKNAKLLMIGTGSLEEKIRNKIKEKSLEDKVIIIQNITNVNEYLQAMDILLMPSLYEGLPVVGIEAQTSGLPCLFSNTITEEIKLTDNCRFIELNDIKLWVNSIEDMRKNYKRKNQAEIIKQKGYDIKTESKKLENYYKQIIKN